MERTEQNEEKHDDTNLTQVSVQLTPEMVAWIGRQVSQRAEKGIRTSASEIVRECMYSGHIKVQQDTELIMSLPIKMLGLVKNKKNGDAFQ